MGSIGKTIKKVAGVVNKIDPIGRQADKLLNKAGLPTASDIGDMLGGAEAPEAPDGSDAQANAAKTVADEKLAAENEAAALANAKAAERAKQRRAGSLLASGGGNSNAQTSSVLAYGKGRLGE
jgi:hypothetical protein